MFRSKHLMHSGRLFFLFFLIFLTAAGTASAADVTLTWSPNQEANLAGYRLHYGTQSKTYSKTVEVGMKTSHALTGLTAGTTYYFAATAYNQQGAESGYSPEVSWTAPAAAPVLGISNLRPGDYRIAPLTIGGLYYTDRSFKISSLPSGFSGLTAIMTANGDKYNNQAEFLSFTVQHHADLYVAYDARATRVPSWLSSGFTNTGRVIETTDVTLALWKKTVPAGAVTLPGNYYGNPAGAHSNYLVLIAPAADSVTPAPSLVVSGLQPGALQTTTLRVGATHFVDRSFTVSGLPARFVGLTAIRTANNDKWNNKPVYLSFVVNREAAVFVAYDSRATRVPSWLSAGYTNTGETIRTTDVTMNLWKRTVPAGTVTVPGNYHGNPAGAESNYFVFVR